jgi:hypothetical protein
MVDTLISYRPYKDLIDGKYYWCVYVSGILYKAATLNDLIEELCLALESKR